MRGIPGIAAFVLAIVILAIASVGAQSSNELIGAWELTEWTNPDGDPVDASSMIVYSAGHYIWLANRGDRPVYSPGEATDEQRVAAFRTLSTNGGTYSISGNRVVSHTTLGKHAYHSGGDYTVEGTFVIDGDWMTFTNDNGGVFKYRRLD